MRPSSPMRERVEAIAEEFLRRNLPITWAATMRADQGDRLAEECWPPCRALGPAPRHDRRRVGSQEMIDRIRKDIKSSRSSRSAEKMPAPRHRGIFPFIVGFPGESDASVRASLDLAKRLRAMSPEFETPIFYFKPYPGSPLTDDAVRDGYRLPADLDEWSASTLSAPPAPGSARRSTASSSASSSTRTSPPAPAAGALPPASSPAGGSPTTPTAGRSNALRPLAPPAAAALVI